MSDTEPSSSFDLLHEKVRRWVWRQGWEELRDIQERAIPFLVEGGRDLVIAASTASGKTEAAFLPIASRLAADDAPRGCGFQAIYVSPLRALINDQFGRLDSLCGELGVPVTKWHGDVAASVKAAARRKPSGILLTTPESLEAILCRNGPDAGRLFRSLAYVVIDEMHSFVDSPRGRQLRSVMHRLEAATGRRAARVGLSATLADMLSSRQFLRPEDPDSVTVLESREATQEIRLQLRGYLEPAKAAAGPAPAGDGIMPGTAVGEIVAHIHGTMRGKRGLVFAGSRRNVELFATGLADLSEKAGLPDEFMAHHGSLSREHREEAERKMRDPRFPATIVSTTTLELGIDVGHIDAVAQYGPGHTVSGLRQRIGRSGRRGGPAVMRAYVQEAETDERSHVIDRLRPTTVQAVAMLNLMLVKWNEPPVAGRLDLSTLVHQILALVVQGGGVQATTLRDRLVSSKVFPDLGIPLLKSVLSRMANPDVGLIEQAPDGTLLAGPSGERITSARDFYAVFVTPKEYRIVTDSGRSLGTVPVDSPLMPEQLVILAGRRWRVLVVDGARKEVVVTSARGGQPPAFGGEPGAPADGVVAEMRRTYGSDQPPPYADKQARAFLDEAKATYARLGLDRKHAVLQGDEILLFPWVGGRKQEALMLSLAAGGIAAASRGIAVSVGTDQSEAARHTLERLSSAPPPDPVVLAKLVEDKVSAKYDWCLGEELLCLGYASERIDASNVPDLARTILSGGWPAV